LPALAEPAQADGRRQCGDAAWLRAQFAQHGNLHDVVRAASERLMRQNNDSRGVTP
jgi:hypothetical protein